MSDERRESIRIFLHCAGQNPDERDEEGNLTLNARSALMFYHCCGVEYPPPHEDEEE